MTQTTCTFNQGEKSQVVNPQRACTEGLRYFVCVCICVSVCYHSSANIAHFYALNKVRRGLSLFSLFNSWILANPSVQKLWHEKANIQTSVYLSRLVLAGLEYHARISRYLKAKQCVSDRLLATSIFPRIYMYLSA